MTNKPFKRAWKGWAYIDEDGELVLVTTTKREGRCLNMIPVLVTDLRKAISKRRK